MAWQATQKEVVDARKKKKVEAAQQKYKKEKKIARCVKAREIRATLSSSSSRGIPQMWMTWFSPRRRKVGRLL